MTKEFKKKAENVTVNDVKRHDFLSIEVKDKKVYRGASLLYLPL